MIDTEARQITPDQEDALAILARQAVTQLELRLTLSEKETALKEVIELRSMLPICCYCKRVRDDDDYWGQLDHYLTQHSEIEFSHSICPDCYPAAEKAADDFSAQSTAETKE